MYDLSVIKRERFCSNCGIVHIAKERCKIGLFYDMKQSESHCPHCQSKYLGDTTEPVKVMIPWEDRMVWESCWKCLEKKLNQFICPHERRLVTVMVPWTRKVIGSSCWACFIRKLEG